MDNKHKGFTFYIVAGKYGGFGVKKDGPLFKISLGWLAFSMGFIDIESLMYEAMTTLTFLTEEYKKLNPEIAERLQTH